MSVVFENQKGSAMTASMNTFTDNRIVCGAMGLENATCQHPAWPFPPSSSGISKSFCFKLLGIARAGRLPRLEMVERRVSTKVGQFSHSLRCARMRCLSSSDMSLSR